MELHELLGISNIFPETSNIGTMILCTQTSLDMGGWMVYRDCSETELFPPLQKLHLPYLLELEHCKRLIMQEAILGHTHTHAHTHTDRGELVSKADPLLLQQHLEAPEGAVVAVQHQHRQGGELGRAVPAVTAVHHHRVARGHLICHLDGP